MHGAEWAYRPRQNWYVCDRCGFKKRRAQVSKEWDGLMVCTATCLDPVPPQLFTPTLWPEGVPIPDARPEPPNLFRVAVIVDGEGNDLVDNDGNRLVEQDGQIAPEPDEF